MTINTRDFGPVELDENEVVEFCAPIFGFEHLRRYVLLSDDEMGPGLFWLQSLEDADVCFILLDPTELGMEYMPEVSGETARELELDGAPIVRLIAVIPQNFKDTTVNLKSPVVINPKTHRAAQVILEADYPIRMPLFAGLSSRLTIVRMLPVGKLTAIQLL